MHGFGNPPLAYARGSVTLANTRALVTEPGPEGTASESVFRACATKSLKRLGTLGLLNVDLDHTLVPAYLAKTRPEFRSEIKSECRATERLGWKFVLEWHQVLESIGKLFQTPPIGSY